MILKQAKPDKTLPNPVNMSALRRKIIWFYKNNGRQFPWRKIRTPYRIMIAEFMLHRTRAQQVAPIYLEFIKKYPTVQTLATAKELFIKKVTEHLGLHWRSRHFIKAAKYVVKHFGGQLPDSREKLLEIPGVGDYVAGAIMTVCFKKKEPVVDSNVARFINRYYGINLSGEIRRKKQIIEKARLLFKYKKPETILFALIDFNSLVCKPRLPQCSACPYKQTCKFDNKNLTERKVKKCNKKHIKSLKKQ